MFGFEHKAGFPYSKSVHHLCVAPSGGGKTCLMRLGVLGLRRLSESGDFPCSIFWLDPKGTDTIPLLREQETLEGVTLLDPSEGFAVNPLALPNYDEDRERFVSLYLDQLMELFDAWFGRGIESFRRYAPRASYLLEVCLRYLYERSDSPTLRDLSDMVKLLHSGDSEKIGRLERDVKRRLSEDVDFRNSLNYIMDAEKNAWSPLVTRLGRFGDDPYLRRIFSPREPTVDLHKCLDPNRLTVLRLSKMSAGGHRSLIMSSLVVAVWFELMLRKEFEGGGPPVFMFVDEFQRLSSLGLIDSFVSESRAYGLRLFLAHQNLAQLRKGLRETVLSNTKVHYVGGVSGKDADVFLRDWGQRKADYHSRLVNQTDRQFAVYDSSRKGEKPVLDWIDRTEELPEPRWSRSEVLEKTVSGESKAAPRLLEEIMTGERKFEKYLPVPVPEEKEWRILKSLGEDSPLRFYQICSKAGVPRDDRSRKVLDGLQSQGFVVYHSKEPERFKLSKKARELFFDPDFESVAPSEEGQRLARKCFENYLDSGSFVSVAIQPGRGFEKAPDLIAFDYSDRRSRSIEIESSSEIETHFEQVRINSEKFEDLGFDECEFWFPMKFSEKMEELEDVNVHMRGVEVD